MSPPSYALPADFLSAPAQNVKLQKIDFAKTVLPEYKSSYAVIIDNALSKTECEALVKAAEATTNGTWEQAMINIGNGQQKLITDARDCGRIIWDDRAMVAKIWDRVKDYVPEIMEIKGKANVTGNGPVKRKETWGFSRLNERMRFLRYTTGQYFRSKFMGY